MKREYNCSSWGFFNKQNWGGHLVSGLQMIAGFQMGPLNKAISLQISLSLWPAPSRNFRENLLASYIHIKYVLNKLWNDDSWYLSVVK